jgi:hypothetical protein
MCLPHAKLVMAIYKPKNCWGMRLHPMYRYMHIAPLISLRYTSPLKKPLRGIGRGCYTARPERGRVGGDRNETRRKNSLQEMGEDVINEFQSALCNHGIVTLSQHSSYSCMVLQQVYQAVVSIYSLIFRLTCTWVIYILQVIFAAVSHSSCQAHTLLYSKSYMSSHAWQSSRYVHVNEIWHWGSKTGCSTAQI